MTKVVRLRGYLVIPWSFALGPLTRAVRRGVLVTGSNMFDAGAVPLRQIRIRAPRDLFPRGRLGDLAMGVFGDRYLRGDEELARADIVHAAELSFWPAG